MAYDEESDSDLVRIDAGHLFTSSITHIGFRRGTFLRRYMLDLIQSFAPHLEPRTVAKAQECFTAAERETLFRDIELPIR